MAAVENDDAHAAADQSVKPLYDASRVGQREFRRMLTDCRDMPFVHDPTIAAPPC